MLTIDDRKGSAEFSRILSRMGLPIRVRRLDCADFAFRGHGPNGPVRIGIERKTVSEMVGTTSRKRFVSGQLPKMLVQYPAHAWLIVEGYCTVDRHDGLLTAGKWEAGFGPDRCMFDHYVKRTVTLIQKARLLVLPTHNRNETAWTVFALYGWYQKDWASHKSAFAVEEQHPDTAIFDERTLRRQTFAQWPGIGWTRSRYVARYFPSIQAAVMASMTEWAAVPYTDRFGKEHRFGPGRARTVVRMLQGREQGQGRDHAKGS